MLDIKIRLASKMRDYKYHYTYLIKNSEPRDEKQFYIGVKSTDEPPIENISYMGSSDDLNEDISRQGISQFEKYIIAEFKNRREAEIHELDLHIEYDVVADKQFYNQKNGTVGFHTTATSTKNAMITRNRPGWQEVNEVSRRENISVALQDTSWKETTGKDKIEKYLSTISSDSWQETIGARKAEKLSAIQNDQDFRLIVDAKHSATVNDLGWKATKGKEQSRKHSETLNDPGWKETSGRAKTKKRLESTYQNPKWVADNTFICSICQKEIKGRNNLNRWHNKNCKGKK